MLKKMTVKQWLGVLIMLLFISMMSIAQAQVASQAGSGAKIAAVNSEKILRDSLPAKVAQQRLESEFSKRDKDLQNLAQRLKAMSDDLDKNSASMPTSRRIEKQNELAQLDLDFQRKQREFREDLNQSRNEELASVLAKANKVIKQIAQQQHYDLIVQEAVYVSPRIDITDQVIKALNVGAAK